MMGHVTYNDIRMEIKHTPIISRDHIMSTDGTTYLYTRWTLEIRAVVNPEALSYALGPVVSTGLIPVDTDHHIRRSLRTPRKKLVYSVGEDILLESPASPATVDSNNGPIPQKVDVYNFKGTKTFFVHFRVVTFVNDCFIKRKRPVSLSSSSAIMDVRADTNPILSHRWTKTETIDRDHYTVISTRGEVVFDTAVMQILGAGAAAPDDIVRAWPDQWRQDLFWFIPRRFKRENIQVTCDSDGTTLSYSYTERQQPNNLKSNWEMTRAECYSTSWYSRNSMVRAVMGAAGAAADLRIGPALLGFASAMIPKVQRNLMVRVWGNANSFLYAPMYTAIGIALNRIGGIPGAAFDSTEFMIQVDDFGRYAECSVTIEYGIEELVRGVGGLGLGAFGAAGLSASMRDSMARLGRRDESTTAAWRLATNDYNFAYGAPGEITFNSTPLRGPLVDTTDPFFEAEYPYEINPPSSNNTRGSSALPFFHALLRGDACVSPACPPSTVTDKISLGVPEERTVRCRRTSSTPRGFRRDVDASHVPALVVP